MSDKLRVKLLQKYSTCRISYWLEINKRKSRIQNVCIAEEVLLNHFKDLSATKTAHAANREFDEKIKAKVQAEMESVIISQ